MKRWKCQKFTAASNNYFLRFQILNFLPYDYKELTSLSTFTSKIKHWETDYANADYTKLCKIYERINLGRIMWYKKYFLRILVKRQILIWISCKILIKQQLLCKWIANRIKQILSLSIAFPQTRIFSDTSLC